MCFTAQAQNCKRRLLAHLFVRPSFRIEYISSHLTDFHEICIWVFFENFSTNLNFHKIRHEERALYMKTNIHFWSYSAQFFLEWKVFQTKSKKIETHILCSVALYQKSCRLRDNVEKFWRVGLATDGNMALAHCMLDT